MVLSACLKLNIAKRALKKSIFELHARVVLRPVSRPRWGGEPRRPEKLNRHWGARFDAQTLPQCGYAMYMIYMSWLRQKTELQKLLMVPNTVWGHWKLESYHW